MLSQKLLVSTWTWTRPEPKQRLEPTRLEQKQRLEPTRLGLTAARVNLPLTSSRVTELEPGGELLAPMLCDRLNLEETRARKTGRRGGPRQNPTATALVAAKQRLEPPRPEWKQRLEPTRLEQKQRLEPTRLGQWQRLEPTRPGQKQRLEPTRLVPKQRLEPTRLGLTAARVSLPLTSSRVTDLEPGGELSAPMICDPGSCRTLA